MASTGRPLLARELEREAIESAQFEIGEGIAFITAVLENDRLRNDGLREAEKEVEHAREALDRAMRRFQRDKQIHEGCRQIASARLKELSVERHHIAKVAESLGVDRTHAVALAG